MKRNMSKPEKRLYSLLLILIMVMVILPVSLSAEEDGEQTEAQVTSEAESETQADSKAEADTSAQTETEPSESTDLTKSEKSEPQAQSNTGSISGMLWHDQNSDGIRDDGEVCIASYPVYLYEEGDLENALQTVPTNGDGEYAFTDVEPGVYVVGVKSNELGTDYYLLPVVGVTGDNKLGAWSDDWDEKYSDVVTIDSNSSVTNIDGGMRTPPGIQPTTAYTINLSSTVTAQTGYTVSSNVITFDTSASSHTYTITGSATDTYRIVIPTGVTANITLSNCSISHSTYSPILVSGTGILNLTLTGSNTTKMSGEGQTTSSYTAGLCVMRSATLTITSSSTGSLTATAGSQYYKWSANANYWYRGGAGIGGGHGMDGGTININGGTVIAKGGGVTTGSFVAGGGAGIGGGSGGDGGTVTISGGTVTVTGGGIASDYAAYGGAGIGGGSVGPGGTDHGAGGTTTISGGIVIATGGGTESTNTVRGAAGIGGTYAAGGGSTYLQGGTVTATAGYSTTCGAYAIGGGSTNSTSTYAKATVVEISSAVTLAAYSQRAGVPAIGSNSITGTGYVVNGYISNRTTHSLIQSLQITLSTTPSGQTLTVPVGYMGIAYSTGASSATDNISVKNSSGTLIGTIVYYSGGAADIQPTSGNVTGQALKFIVTYTITYAANGGSGTMSNTSFEYGTSFTLRTNAFTRTGYAFLGWSTNKSATVATYTDGATVSGTEFSADTTLYAVWQVAKYAVYNSGGTYIGGAAYLSTAVDLCNATDSYTIKALGNDTDVSANLTTTNKYVTIPNGYNITLTSNTSTSTYTITQTYAYTSNTYARHLYVANGGSLTLKNVILEGTNTGSSGGGGVYVYYGGTLNMDNATIQNCYSSSSGGEFI
ncbi:MAG: InlB B-repeat-containing protein [Lachnospiraceae bacterium]